MAEFLVPLYTEDLETPTAGRYSVASVLNIETANVEALLDGLTDTLLNASDVFATVLDHGVFDTAYSCVKFWSHHSAGTQQRVLELLSRMVEEVLGALAEEQHASGGAPLAPAAAALRRNAFKAASYLFAIGVQVAEKTSAPAAAAGGVAGGAGAVAAVATKGAKGKGGKAAAAAAVARRAEEGGDDDGGAFCDEGNAPTRTLEWAGELRSSSLVLLAEIVSCEHLRCLWPQGVPEESFAGVFPHTGLRLLGSVGMAKDKDARARAVRLVALSAARFPSVVTATVVGLMGILVLSDSAAAAAVDAVELWWGAGAAAGAAASADAETQDVAARAPHVAAELLREAGRVAPGGDASGLKRVASFVADVSVRVPGAVAANMHSLLPHLDSEAPAIRAALVAVLGNVIAGHSAKITAAAAAEAAGAMAAAAAAPEDAPPAASTTTAASLIRTRDVLCAALLERAYDSHAHVRAAALKSAVALVQRAALPAERLPALTAIATDRVHDKAALVRRAAAILLRGVIECNPFGSRLDAASFGAQADAADAWLKVHAPFVFARLTGDTSTSPASLLPPVSKGGAPGGATVKRGIKGLAAIDEEEDDEGEGGEKAAEGLPTDAAAVATQLADDAAKAEGGGNDAGDMTVSAEAAGYVTARTAFGAARAFAAQVASAVPSLVALMSSKTGSDVMEAIRCLAQARAFGVPGAEAGLGKMLVLVWSEGPVRLEVVKTFHRLFLLNEALGDGEEEGEGAFGSLEGGADGAGVATTAVVAPAAPAPKAVRAPRAAAAKKKKAASSSGEEDEEGESDEEDEEEEDSDAPKRRKAPKAKAPPKKARAAPKKATANAAATTGAPGRGRGVSAKAAAAAAEAAAAADPSIAAENLVTLLNGASLAVRASLEEVLRECAKAGLLPPACLTKLWDIVSFGLAASARTRLELISFLAHAQGAGEGGSAALIAGVSRDRFLLLASSADTALQRARAALSLLAMAASAMPGALLEGGALTPLRALLAVLTPQSHCGGPTGRALLNGAMALLCPPNGPGSAWSPRDVQSVFGLLSSLADYRLARHACVLLLRIVTIVPTSDAAGAVMEVSKGRGGKGAAAAAAAAEAAIIERSTLLTQLETALVSLIRGDWDGGDVEHMHWYAGAQVAIDALFILSPVPGGATGPLLHAMVESAALCAPAMAANAPTHSPRLARLFFAAGHIAVRTLVHVEALASRVKLLRIRTGERAEVAAAAAAAAPPATATGGAKSKGAAAAAAATAAAAPKANSAEKDGIEEQLGVAAAEDEREEALVSSIAEHELVAGNMLSCLSPLMRHIAERVLEDAARAPPASTPAEEQDPIAQAALLSLTKLMAVSARFCESHLQLVFTVLSSARSPWLRGIIAVALGDLAFRFPNLLEPYQAHLYSRLRDTDSGVRRNTVMVLSHLVLNDMVKLKGQVGELAVCLNDSDPRIADLTRMFFTELSKRSNNPIYNLFPDALSCLSRLVHRGGSGSGVTTAPSSSITSSSTVMALEPSTFRDIICFLLSFISKDKHADALGEKLLLRLEAACNDDTSGSAEGGEGGSITSGGSALARDLAYCMSQLPASDRSVRRLAEGVRLYKRALGDDDVWGSFCDMVSKARRLTTSAAAAGAAAAPGGASAGRAELRAVIDKWEGELAEARTGGVQDEGSLLAAKAAARRAKRVAASAGMDSSALTAEALAAATSSVAAAAAESAGAKRGKAGAGAKGAKAKAAPAAPDAKKRTAAAAAAAARRKKAAAEEEGEDEEEEEESGGESAPPPRAVAAPARRAVGAGGRLRKMASSAVSSDDGGDSEAENAAPVGKQGGAGGARAAAAASSRG